MDDPQYLADLKTAAHRDGRFMQLPDAHYLALADAVHEADARMHDRQVKAWEAEMVAAAAENERKVAATRAAADKAAAAAAAVPPAAPSPVPVPPVEDVPVRPSEPTTPVAGPGLVASDAQSHIDALRALGFTIELHPPA